LARNLIRYAGKKLRADGKRFIVRADEMLTAFVELQRVKLV